MYDTGGLNLKSTGGRGMKGELPTCSETTGACNGNVTISSACCLFAGDMAGSAATLGAFAFWAKFSAAHPEAAFPGKATSCVYSDRLEQF